jgi:hypothetical protein
MSHWKNKIVNLGIIKAGTPKQATFIALPTIPAIEKIRPYCGCTTTQYDTNKGELIITYSNGKIPDQVQGAQSISKRIDITYADGLSEVLTIQATRIK